MSKNAFHMHMDICSAEVILLHVFFLFFPLSSLSMGSAHKGKNLLSEQILSWKSGPHLEYLHLPETQTEIHDGLLCKTGRKH